jgi:beta-glucanase (GH16 family)
MLSTARPDVNREYPFPFTYGFVESRLRFPPVPGFFTAFWMVPTDPTYEYRTELDIVEILGGQPNTAYMSYHYDNRNKSYKVNSGPGNNGACPVQDYSNEWVTFGVDWQPDHIAWYINDTKCGEFTDRAQIENGPMQIILMTSIDNQWERDAASVLTDQQLVMLLEVDFVRVYQAL